MAGTKKTGPLARPDTLAVFPLDGALLLPGRHLPLNIFEPRYLNMIDDVLGGDRSLGMVQTDGTSRQTSAGTVPGLAPVGTLGRVVQFQESDDGRYQILLKGLSRFHIDREIGGKTPYRRAQVSYSAFSADVIDPGPKESERGTFMTAVKSYATLFPVEVDWEAMDLMKFADLVDELTMICPFDRADKQALLEARTLEARRKLLVGLFELSVLRNRDGGNTLQ